MVLNKKDKERSIFDPDQIAQENLYHFELEGSTNSLTFSSESKEFPWKYKDEVAKRNVNWSELVDNVFRSIKNYFSSTENLHNNEHKSYLKNLNIAHFY